MIGLHEFHPGEQAPLEPGVEGDRPVRYRDREARLGHLCDFTKGDFLHMPFEDASFDAAYAIEAGQVIGGITGSGTTNTLGVCSSTSAMGPCFISAAG